MKEVKVVIMDWKIEKTEEKTGIPERNKIITPPQKMVIQNKIKS